MSFNSGNEASNKLLEILRIVKSNGIKNTDSSHLKTAVDAIDYLKNNGKKLPDNALTLKEKANKELEKRKEQESDKDKDGLDINSGYKCPKGMVDKKFSLTGKLKSMTINTKDIPVVITSYTNFLNNLNAAQELSSSLNSLKTSYSNFHENMTNPNTAQEENERSANNVIQNFLKVQNFLNSDVKIKSSENNSSTFFNSKIPDEVSFACLSCYISALRVKNNEKSNSFTVSKDGNGNLVVTNDKNQEMNIDEKNSKGFYNKNFQDNISNEKDPQDSSNEKDAPNQPTEGDTTRRKLTSEEIKKAREENGLNNNTNEIDMQDYYERKNKQKQENPEEEMTEEERANKEYLEELAANGMSLGPTPHTENDD